MKDLLYQSIWLMIPAAVANASPVLFRWIPFLNIPIDGNRKWRGRAILGKHKTYRGFFIGVGMAIVVAYIQRYFFGSMQTYSLFDYTKVNMAIVGFLLGFGALSGDALKSFLKRRVGIDPGKPWPPFDQIDWIIGALACMSLYRTFSFSFWIVSIVFFGLVHVVADYIAYLIHIKESKY
ncbi:MAG: CDP-2,3-bis-(O-geranylgeranyl)-sn-glycerol synthase [Candidatus Peregrinibacteria bacterium]|nr:CDP-2,3-bis-(O-geranylgeranyl)-sn-glycerol synthase [Candidatus Peregrinibacteria bacterium]